MSKDITIASTTDTQEEVNRAAGLPGETPPSEEQPEKVAGEQPPETGGEQPPKPEEPSEAGKEPAKPEEEAEAEAAQPEEAKEAEEEPEKGKAKKGGFQKRIDKLTRRNYELEERLEEITRQNEQLLQQREGKAPAPVIKEPPAAEKPTPDKFETYEEYVEAVGKWTAQQQVKAALDERRQAEEKEAEDHRAKETLDTYNERVLQARGKYEDFDEVVGRDDVQIPQGVQLAVIELENGPEIAYYLGKHPEVCKRLCELSPLAAIAEVGKISAALMPEETPEGSKPPAPAAGKKVSTGAPPPIKPVGGSKTPSTVPLDQLDYRSYRKIRDQQVKDRYRQ